MEKLFTLFAALLLCLSAAICQTPVMTMTTSKAIGSDFSFRLGSQYTLNNTPVKVDFGDGILVEKILAMSVALVDTGTLISGTLGNSQSIKVYGAGITFLNCNSTQLISLDVSKDTSLVVLKCNNNQLASIDVSKNLGLFILDCSFNQLTSLDLSNNHVSGGDWFCTNNRITLLITPINFSIRYFYCQNNYLTFASLPDIYNVSGGYVWYPQNPFPIVKTLGTGVELDLSMQLIVKGDTTVYTWITKSGDTLVVGKDYSLTNGKTVFIKAQTDSVNCWMTNVNYPYFKGSSFLLPITTTYTNVTGTVGIDDNAAEPDIQIFARNKTIYINAPTNGQVSVYDLNGRMVANKAITAGSNTIAMQKGGVYLLRFTGNNVPVTKKIFIEN